MLRAEDLHWHHSIDLGDGTVTRGCTSIADQEKKGGLLPADLRGASVLDVGARDGVYSFLAEQRGAERVVALDPVPTAGFAYARAALRSKVELVDVPLERYEPDGAFDVVICYGVLYHVRDPHQFMERLGHVTADRLFFESLTAPRWLAPWGIFDNARWGLFPDDSTYVVPSRPWIRRAMASLGLAISHEEPWLGAGWASRTPALPRLPGAARLVPARYLVEARRG